LFDLLEKTLHFTPKWKNHALGGYVAFFKGLETWNQLNLRSNRFSLIIYEENWPENSTSIVLNDLFRQHALMGVMLGYGRQNAENFQRHWELTMDPNRPPLLTPRKKPSKGFFSVEEELAYLDRFFQHSTKKPSTPMHLVIPLPVGRNPNDSEAPLIGKKHDSLHRKLTEIFKREDWVETILSQFTQEAPLYKSLRLRALAQ